MIVWVYFQIKILQCIALLHCQSMYSYQGVMCYHEKHIICMFLFFVSLSLPSTVDHQSYENNVS